MTEYVGLREAAALTGIHRVDLAKSCAAGLFKTASRAGSGKTDPWIIKRDEIIELVKQRNAVRAQGFSNLPGHPRKAQLDSGENTMFLVVGQNNRHTFTTQEQAEAHANRLIEKGYFPDGAVVVAGSVVASVF